MKRVLACVRACMQKTTVRFMLFYLVLVLLPAIAFINVYAGNLHRQALQEQRYEKKEALKLSAQYFSRALEEISLVADTLQSSTPLLTLLSGGYPSAADELYAYSAYIQPLFDSVSSIHPALDGLYLYRLYPSFIGNNGLVQNLCDYSELNYTCYNEGDCAFLAVTPEQFRHREGDSPSGARYVRLCSLYSSDYTQIVAVLELQLRLDDILQSVFPVIGGGQLCLGYEGTYYPIVQAGTAYHLDVEHPLAHKPAASDQTLLLEESVAEMSLLWELPLIAAYGEGTHSSLAMVMLMLIPLAVFWLYILHYTRSISRFSRHIHATGSGMPKPYEGAIRKDEFGDVVREYNDMTRTIEELIASVQEAERLKNAANYYAMTSQVNPHFMFNTLENIRMHIELEKYDDASQMLFTLSRFLRYNISLREESSLEEEFEHARHYVLIYQYRIHHMISFDIRRDADVPSIRCPVRILQPIVENSLQHGITGQNHPIHVDVHAWRGEDGVYIDVTDDGCGMSDEAIAELNARLETANLRRQDQAEEHVGLDNVNARIKYFYGAAYGLHFTHARPAGVVCRMHIGLAKLPALKGGKST